MSRIKSIELEITLADGSTSKAQISADYGWQQWGAVPARLSETVEALDAMTQALAENGLLADEEEDEEEDA